jgi:hypothetical protein
MSSWASLSLAVVDELQETAHDEFVGFCCHSAIYFIPLSPRLAITGVAVEKLTPEKSANIGLRQDAL